MYIGDDIGSFTPEILFESWIFGIFESIWPLIWHNNVLQGGPSGRIVGLGWLRSVMFHHLAHLLGQFCQFTISPRRTKQKVENQSQPNPVIRPDGPPFISRSVVNMCKKGLGVLWVTTKLTLFTQPYSELLHIWPDSLSAWSLGRVNASVDWCNTQMLFNQFVSSISYQ